MKRILSVVLIVAMILCIFAGCDKSPGAEKKKLHIANSIWFSDQKEFTANKDFLQTNADYYGADIFKAPFNASTLTDINEWVKDKTDGKFTTENGEKQNVKMMCSNESQYLKDENAIGFIKYYAGSQYAFAALLPNKGVTVDEYIASLTGESLYAMLSAPTRTDVYAVMPRFESEDDTDTRKALISMGMQLAFDEEKADFSGLGTSKGGNIFIDDVLHKTYISVNETGTVAGASTAAKLSEAAESALQDPKEVILDRPFVYMLIDWKETVPLFIGTVMDMD